MSVPPDTGVVDVASPAPVKRGLVFRNTLFLMAAQVVGMPLSIVVNAAIARYLGAEDFGYIYLAQTFAAFGFLFVDWGQISALTAAIARERPRAGELLGSGLSWRLGASVVVYVVLAGGCYAAGYDRRFQIALGLVAAGSTIAAVTSSFQDTIRGFERTDVPAFGLMAQQFLTAAFVVPTLYFGGRLHAALIAQAAAYAVVSAFVFRALLRMKIGALAFRRSTVKLLLKDGWPFLTLGLVNALQPNVDAVFLSKLSTAEAVGWLAAARKLVGVLIFPSASLIGALYPTMCRLFSEDKDAFVRTAGSALRTSTILVVPISFGCALYADVGIRIFSRSAFAPAEDDLRVLAAFVFFVYFSMVLGASLAAAGLQRPWAFVQFGCVAISAIVDPILIPYFERRSGNGGLGVCVTTIGSEVFVLIAGYFLAPKGIFDRALFRSAGLALLAGLAMVAVARLLHTISPFLAAPVAVAAYCGALYLVGGVDEEQVSAIRGIIARKTGRA